MGDLPAIQAVVVADDRLDCCWAYATESRRPGEPSDHAAASRAKAIADRMQERSLSEQWGQRYEVVEFVPRTVPRAGGCRK